MPGGTALAVDREIFSAGGARAGDGASATSPWCARRSTALPSPGVVATGPAHLGAARRGHRRPARHRRRSRSTTPSRRSCRADSLDHERLYAPRATARARATTTSTRRWTRDRVRGASSTRCSTADQHHGARVRPGAVLRGLPAGRGDGAPRARDAALRADEAGRAARSAHRPRAVRRGAAPPGGPRGADVEPGRLPDPAPDPGAAAGVPDDPGTGAGGVPALRQHPPELVPQQPGEPRAGASPRGTTTGSFFAGQLTGVEGYTESLGTGLLAGINLARRLAGEASRGAAADHDARRRSTATCARRTRSTSSR